MIVTWTSNHHTLSMLNHSFCMLNEGGGIALTCDSMDSPMTGVWPYIFSLFLCGCLFCHLWKADSCENYKAGQRQQADNHRSKMRILLEISCQNPLQNSMSKLLGPRSLPCLLFSNAKADLGCDCPGKLHNYWGRGGREANIYTCNIACHWSKSRWIIPLGLATSLQLCF